MECAFAIGLKPVVPLGGAAACASSQSETTPTSGAIVQPPVNGRFVLGALSIDPIEPFEESQPASDFLASYLILAEISDFYSQQNEE